MLTKIELNHFKCFDTLKLPLAPLTILSGLNAAGKSSVLQALALLHQTVIQSQFNRTLILNGNILALGTVGDVIDKISGRNEFSIRLQSTHFECTWLMKTDNRLDLAVPIYTFDWKSADTKWELKKIEAQKINQRFYRLLPKSIWNSSKNAQQLASMLDRLTYVSAERIGPRETYQTTTLQQQSNVGSQGEFTPWYLYSYANQKVLDKLIYQDASPHLLRQTEAWMSHFFPGMRLQVKPVEGANLITMGIRTSDETDFHRPQNVGYGITYMLPILAACLGAQDGDLILIENPEAHLHPAGQAEIGRFLAMTASAGVQVILETHSDHVLNGIRRSVKEQILLPADVAIHFFNPRHKEKFPEQVISPLINKNGSLDTWPEGFFDQFDKDMSALIDW